MEGGEENQDEKIPRDCTFCRVTGTCFLSGLSVYSFICAKKAQPKSFHKAFCVLFGTSSLILGVCRAFNMGFFK
ncbi:putative integral membrane protein [Theileria parva strain Muguga]|uniref:putative integral membrane protein n=1 Tax=Theileria parva strain Muguga TaxID=333668 RepID=UPI001C61F2D9|nr:putative integral membrane protein [Theileria parva strain Muguga]EAN32037.2 putative integral membrane protein [Theileria parva strain Muguga]